MSSELEDFAHRIDLELPIPATVDKKLGALYTQEQLFDFSYDAYVYGYREAYG